MVNSPPEPVEIAAAGVSVGAASSAAGTHGPSVAEAVTTVDGAITVSGASTQEGTLQTWARVGELPKVRCAFASSLMRLAIGLGQQSLNCFKMLIRSSDFGSKPRTARS